MKLLRAVSSRAVFIRGNADRAVVELAGTAGEEPALSELDGWMVQAHSGEAVAFLAGFHFSVTVVIDGLDAVRFCHGSPRSDQKMITPNTSRSRLREIFAACPEDTLVHGHTHLQYERTVGINRVVGPGSVGLPYHSGQPGTAYWALLGPDVELRQTSYDLADAVARIKASGNPRARSLITQLTQPPTPATVMEYAENAVYSD